MVLSTSNPAVVGTWRNKLARGVDASRADELQSALQAAQRCLRSRSDLRIVAQYQLVGARLHVASIACLPIDRSPASQSPLHVYFQAAGES